MGGIDYYYDKLLEKYKAITILQTIENFIFWDMETKMPPRGIDLRSEQFASLSGIKHKMITDPDIGSLLDKIEKSSDYDSLNFFRRRNVYLIRKIYDEQTKLPEKLVRETAKQEAVTTDVWKKAKAAKEFSIYKPELEKLINLKKKAAEILMDVKGTISPYDALIDIYEPKMTSNVITKVFDELKEGLTLIIDKCRTAEKQPLTILNRNVSIDIQKKISSCLARFIDYDVESKKAGGRIDETEHPFTTGYYDDVRITTHYYENNIASSIFSVLHEGGHAIYDQNLNPDWKYQPIGDSSSLGFHESQSRYLENIVGRSQEFWIYFYPKLNELTGSIFSDVDLNSFVFAINQVKASKIRTEADEVTYCLHIIIRFEIEREIMDDKISVDDLPEIWNQKYLDYLDVEVENDSEGVMQDSHWAGGSIGYFPTYALGNIYSGQILSKMQKDISDWRNQITKGNLHEVKQWLTENVYRYGNLYDPPDLIKKITDEELKIQPFLSYLNTKYAKLYGF